eukprot:m.118538 g.118538  ORF g.118538 m.118538 type:complete len:641 (-) comp16434_c0_seq4:278-2200(-)
MAAMAWSCVVAVAMALVFQARMASATPEAWSPFAYGNSKAAPGLKWFNNARFGMFMHWGPVSQWGTEISFPLVCQKLPCSVEGPGKKKIEIKTLDELKAHRQAYADLAKTFNPTQFDPVRMADLAYKAGFRYIMYTSVHCDGFVNWPSNLTEYNIMNTPYGKDLLGELVTAFRARGLKIGMYLCPSFWNNNSYWAPDALTALGPVCRPNYLPAQQPQQWSTFLSYFHGLIKELAVLYKPDAFWFDCSNSPPAEDTFLEQVMPFLREQNPDVVLNLRNGEFSDYFETRDQSEALASSLLGSTTVKSGVQFEVPSVLQSTRQWAYDPTSSQKPASEIVANLLLLNSKAGNYLLNVAPDPTGLWAPSAIQVLEELANWTAINGEAIYGTQPLSPFQSGGVFVFSKPGAIYAAIPTHAPAGRLSAAAQQLAQADSAGNTTVALPWIRPGLLAQGLQGVDLLGLGPVAYVLNGSGLYAEMPAVVNVMPLKSYYSSINKDHAPCALRDHETCSVYTQDHYTLTRTEGYCQAASNAEANVVLRLDFDDVYVDNALDNGTAIDGYKVVDTECYGSSTPGPGRVPLYAYWNNDAKDRWDIASEASISEAKANGYVNLGVIAYVWSSPGSNHSSSLAPVLKLSFPLSQHE